MTLIVKPYLPVDQPGDIVTHKDGSKYVHNRLLEDAALVKNLHLTELIGIPKKGWEYVL